MQRAGNRIIAASVSKMPIKKNFEIILTITNTLQHMETA